MIKICIHHWLWQMNKTRTRVTKVVSKGKYERDAYNVYLYQVTRTAEYLRFDAIETHHHFN